MAPLFLIGAGARGGECMSGYLHLFYEDYVNRFGDPINIINNKKELKKE